MTQTDVHGRGIGEQTGTPASERLSFGERAADGVASFGGSWPFIGLFLLVMAVWMGLNSFLLIRHPFDPYPYILLNLVLSCLAAIQAPIIMMRLATSEQRSAPLLADTIAARRSLPACLPRKILALLPHYQSVSRPRSPLHSRNELPAVRLLLLQLLDHLLGAVAWECAVIERAPSSHRVLT